MMQNYIHLNGGSGASLKVCNILPAWPDSLSLTCTVAATHTCYSTQVVCFICLNSSSVQNRLFWFILLHTEVIAEIKEVYQISVKQKLNIMMSW